jgi:hypothetical protein
MGGGCNRPTVVARPVEATNRERDRQAVATGVLPNINAAHRLIGQSFE